MNRIGDSTMWMDVRNLSAVALLAATLTLGGCGPAEANGSDEELPETGRVLNVEVETVQPVEFAEVVRLTGTVGANRDVTVSAEESGVITELLVPKGATVAAGQPLLRIDDRLLQSQVAQARAQAALARELWDRRRRLFEEDKVGSELAYLEAKYQAEQAQAALATLERRMERATVAAPIEGVLDARLVEVGTMVNPGTPVARIVDMDPVKIIGGVPERYAADIRPGARASVTFDALEGLRFGGNINYVGAAIDPSNRTFPVEFVLANAGRAVKPEMVANIEVERRVIRDALVVPQEALVRVEDGYVVFVIEDERAVAKPVVLGPSQRNQAVVTSGIAAGDRLVVVGQKQLAAGDRVRIVGES
jgi:membrane fusion protein (multidrug efflux system)